MPCSNHSPYGCCAGDLALDVGVVDDHAALEVDEEELAGLQAALALDLVGRNVHHAGLGAEHDPAVLGLQPAAGAQAVAVQRRADHAAVGERDRRRAVPRLHQAGVEGVEALQVLGQVVPVLVGLRDHHHHRVRQAAAGQHEQLEHVVERRGVAAARADDREHLRQVLAEQLRRELRLARAHPVDVPAQRVDLAVVGDHPVRVRELPARERVRGEPGVDERQRRLRARVLEVGVVAQQLRAGEHALVDDRAAGERRDHELRAGGDLRHAADHVQLALEGVLVQRQLVGRGDDEVLDVRREEVGRDADVVLVHRHVAPLDDALALVGDRGLEQLLELLAAVLLARQEADADAVRARLGQLGVDDAAHELVGQLEQDSGAVARVRVGARRAAMLEVLERDDRALDGLVGGHRIELCDHGDTAGVVLVGRVVEADPAAWAFRHRRATGGGRGTPSEGSEGNDKVAAALPGTQSPGRGVLRLTQRSAHLCAVRAQHYCVASIAPSRASSYSAATSRASAGQA